MAFDINEDDYGNILHDMCYIGATPAVSMLLAHPLIQVNKLSSFGQTALASACAGESLDAFRLLLADPRVDAQLCKTEDNSPLMNAFQNTNMEMLQWLVASGKELGDVVKMIQASDENEERVLEIDSDAEEENYCKDSRSLANCRMFMHRLSVQPDTVRYEVRFKLKRPEAMAAWCFALVVFLCDGLLQPQAASWGHWYEQTNALRFFAIASELPMELQMILCNRTVGRACDSILKSSSEPAFVHLAQKYPLVLPPSPSIQA